MKNLFGEDESEIAKTEQVTPQVGTLELSCEDCMDLMRRYPDGHFDLAIVDPPYGIGMDACPQEQNI